MTQQPYRGVLGGKLAGHWLLDVSIKLGGGGSRSLCLTKDGHEPRKKFGRQRGDDSLASAVYPVLAEHWTFWFPTFGEWRTEGFNHGFYCGLALLKLHHVMAIAIAICCKRETALCPSYPSLHLANGPSMLTRWFRRMRLHCSLAVLPVL
jgi:hypothetical protein